MRCENHTSDLTSTFAVCASCLRERLTSLLQAQAQARDQARLARVISRATAESSANSSDTDPNNLHPPLIFPRSVSPYRSGRNEKLFYSTPQVGSTFYGDGKKWKKKKSLRKFWNFSDLFRSRSEKFRSDQLCEKSSPALPSWFSKVLPDRRKNRDRFGMSSPARGEIFAGECNQTTSTSGCSSDCTPRSRRTLPDAAATKSTRRSRLGLEKSVSDSGMAFCLSPLVRLNHNGLPPELAAAAAVKPHLSAAASFCNNRSRKLADFGKVNHNR